MLTAPSPWSTRYDNVREMGRCREASGAHCQTRYVPVGGFFSCPVTVSDADLTRLGERCFLYPVTDLASGWLEPQPSRDCGAGIPACPSDSFPSRPRRHEVRNPSSLSSPNLNCDAFVTPSRLCVFVFAPVRCCDGICVYLCDLRAILRWDGAMLLSSIRLRLRLRRDRSSIDITQPV